MRRLWALIIVFSAAGTAHAQPLGPGPAAKQDQKQDSTPIPVDVALSDLKSAYAGITAEEMTLKIKTPQGAERTDRITVRLDPGADERPRRLMLELGTLRALLAEGQLTVISTSSPGKCYRRTYSGPITRELVSSLLPPIPLPQLDLLDNGLEVLKNPTPYTPGVAWTGATAFQAAHPPSIIITGSCPAGPISISTHLQSARLIRLLATIKAKEGDTALDIGFRALEPGDPASWAIPTESCEAVASLAELKPAARPVGPIQPGQPAPDLAFTRPDMTPWTLAAALDAGRPLALILFRGGGPPDQALAAANDARAGLALLRALRLGRPLPGETAAAPALDLTTAAAIVLELGEFSPAKWEEAQRSWGTLSRARAPASAIEADDLMWAPGAAQTLDRFAPGSAALIAIINPDRTLRGLVRLDGRGADPSAVGVELRALLK